MSTSSRIRLQDALVANVPGFYHSRTRQLAEVTTLHALVTMNDRGERIGSSTGIIEVTRRLDSQYLSRRYWFFDVVDNEQTKRYEGATIADRTT